jgi:hypothetical protein
MIIVGGRTHSGGARSHRSTQGAQVFRWACTAGPAGRERAAAAAAGVIAAVTGHGSIPGSARRLDTQS